MTSLTNDTSWSCQPLEAGIFLLKVPVLGSSMGSTESVWATPRPNTDWVKATEFSKFDAGRTGVTVFRMRGDSKLAGPDCTELMSNATTL